MHTFTQSIHATRDLCEPQRRPCKMRRSRVQGRSSKRKKFEYSNFEYSGIGEGQLPGKKRAVPLTRRHVCVGKTAGKRHNLNRNVNNNGGCIVLLTVIRVTVLRIIEILYVFISDDAFFIRGGLVGMFHVAVLILHNRLHVFNFVLDKIMEIWLLKVLFNDTI